MLWEEKPTDLPMTQRIVDLNFKIQCRMLSIDHAYALSQSIAEALPWFADSASALHLIHGAESGNGWVRQEAHEGEALPCMYLSHRAKLTLRLPVERVADAQILTGKTLTIGTHPLVIGKSTIKKLTTIPILFARYIVADPNQPEEDFITQVHQDLKATGISCYKMICGRTHDIRFPDKTIFTRSLMIADLAPPESIQLQQQGYGEGNTFGCGIFLPHKDIKPVQQAQEKL